MIKLETNVLIKNISLMIFTAWLIYYFNNGWWILVFIVYHSWVEREER